MEKSSSFLLSLALHGMIVFLILFWPAATVLDLDREVYQVSLVVGDMGGEGLASAVLGARPDQIADKVNPALEAGTQPEAPTQEELAPEELPEPVAPPQDIETPKETPVQAEDLPQPESIPPTPQPLPEIPTEALIPQIPKEDEPKIEEEPKPKPKPEPRPEPEPKPEPRPEPKPEPRPEPKPEKPKTNPPKTNSSSTSQSKKPNQSAASSALADLQRELGSGGVGGGAGTGKGPGGGGIYDVYMAQVMLVVQSEWSMPTYSRENYSTQVAVKLDKNGKIIDSSIVKSSGRADFDASAMNALLRLGSLPAPPNANLQDIVLVFNSAQ